MSNIDTIATIIQNRRTIKAQSYNGQIISKENIDRLLELANWAPTHALTEPWRFVVMAADAVNRFCEDHANLYKANTEAEKFVQGAYDKLKTQGEKASHIIAVFSKRGAKPNIQEIEEICASAAAVQNLLLGAEAMGLASFWSTGGQTLKPAMKKYFKLLPEDQMIGLLYLGYSDQPKTEGRRLTPIEDKVMWYNR